MHINKSENKNDHASLKKPGLITLAFQFWIERVGGSQSFLDCRQDNTGGGFDGFLPAWSLSPPGK
jgi:hypothetical protein